MLKSMTVALMTATLLVCSTAHGQGSALPTPGASAEQGQAAGVGAGSGDASNEAEVRRLRAELESLRRQVEQTRRLAESALLSPRAGAARMPASEAQQAPRAPQTPGVPQAPQAPQSPEQPARLALPSVELAELLRQVAARSGKDFVVDARVPPRIYVRGTSLDNPSYPVLLAILRADGFAAVEIQGRVHIVPDGEVRQMAVPLAQNDDASIPDEECVTRILTVTTRNPAGLVPVLRPLMPQWAHLAAVVNEPEQGRTTGGKLLITDSYANVKRITALVRELTQ